MHTKNHENYLSFQSRKSLCVSDTVLFFKEICNFVVIIKVDKLFFLINLN